MRLIFTTKVLASCIILISMLASQTLADVDKSGVKPGVLSLPSGPGAIEGLGESFEAQMNSGTSSYRINLAALPGRTGFAPNLTLVYNSGAGAGVWGMGWKIEIPYIQRQTDKGLPFYTLWPNGDGKDNDQDGHIDEPDEFDTIIYNNGEELIPLSDGSFRCENEDSFIKFSNSDNGWIAVGKNGVQYQFGMTAAGRVQDDSGRVFKWLLEKTTDLNGNVIVHTWESKDSGYQRYCTEISYNPAADTRMQIQFEYEERPDILMDYRSRFEIKTAFRCSKVRMFEGENLIRAYHLTYESTSDTQPMSLLASITQIGMDNQSILPPAQFTYTQFSIDNAAVQDMPSSPTLSLAGGNIDLMDLNADGLPDILDTNDTVHDYYLNKGIGADGKVAWSAKTAMTSMPKQLYLGSSSVKLADMDGQGSTDILNLFGTDVAYYNIEASESGMAWAFAGYINEAGFDFADNNVRLTDMNNDKRIDVVRTGGSDLFVWLNLDDGRWSEAFTGLLPNNNLSFDQSDVHLADMNGDRLQDLVWIKNDVCVYYPNKGFGEFDRGITMSNPPFGITNAQHLFMTDINGDGLSDAVYVTNGTARVWLNLGIDTSDHTHGRFANMVSITGPYTDSSSVYRQCDINGNGSTDILWNTFPMGANETFAYIDFSPGEQPYQLKTITNGIGRTTTISYRSSVEDMVRDRDNGEPWPEVIPFPVPVVAKIEVNDGLNTYTTEFEYHDGYYDGDEKEFRGFAAAR